MIRISKSPPPRVLSERGAEWTAEFVALIDAGGDLASPAASRYRHREIRDQLMQETAGKCAYCESHIEHVSFPNIEHIAPKIKFPEGVCDWDNLTLACTVCNTAKGDYFDDDCALINPYVDEVDEHLRFFGPMLVPMSPDRGRATISRLKLNRDRLVAKRKEAVERMMYLLELVSTATGPIKAVLLEEIRQETQDDREFAGVRRAYLRFAGSDGV